LQPGELASELRVDLAEQRERRARREAAAKRAARRSGLLARELQQPRQLGLARAYVSGDLEIHGNAYEALRRLFPLPLDHVTWSDRAKLAKEFVKPALARPTPPAQERQLKGGRHSKGRDAEAIEHHLIIAHAAAGIIGVEFACGSQRGFLPETGKMKNAQRTCGAAADGRYDCLTHNGIVRTQGSSMRRDCKKNAPMADDFSATEKTDFSACREGVNSLLIFSVEQMIFHKMCLRRRFH
jgi:hypothetical protein